MEDDCFKKDFDSDHFSSKDFVVFTDVVNHALIVDGCTEIIDLLDTNVQKEYQNAKRKWSSYESYTPKEKFEAEEYYCETIIYHTIKSRFEDVLSGIAKTYFFTGAKSIGKTLTTNFLLNKYDKEMEEKKIIWIRCDCSKIMEILYQTVLQQSDTREFNTDNDIIKEYFDIQFLYFFCKYYNTGTEEYPGRSFFREIYELFNNRTVWISEAKDPLNLASEKGTTKEVKVQEKIQEINREIWRAKGAYGNQYHYGREKIYKTRFSPKIKQRALRQWLEISSFIQTVLIGKRYKFLKIIDGIDDYHKYDNKGKLNREYQYLLTKISDFHNNHEMNDRKDTVSIMVLMRKNTFEYYQTIRPIVKTQEGVFSVDLYKNAVSDKASIFGKRYDYLAKTMSRDNIILSTLKSIIEHEKHLPRVIVDFLDADKHTGFYLSNMLSLVPALVYYYRKYELLNNASMMAFYYSYRPVNFLLHGAFRQDEKNDKNVNQRIMYNIFFYDAENYNKGGKWQGLCTTRILQTLLIKINKISRRDLIAKIMRLFRYNKTLIEVCLSKLLDYGLIRYREDDSQDATEDFNMDAACLSITSKGKYLLPLVYSNIDILYHCALSAPMPVEFVSRDQFYIQAHNNGSDIKDYAKSCIKTSFIMTQYLKHIDAEERQPLPEYDGYELPFDYEIVHKRFSSLYSSLSKEQQEELRMFIEGFKNVEYPKQKKREKKENIPENIMCFVNNDYKKALGYLDNDKYFRQAVRWDTNENNIEKYKEIYLTSLLMLSKLHITNTMELKNIYHYTSFETADELILTDREYGLFFADGTNDADEGRVFLDLFDIDTAPAGYESYIGCFSLLQDDINQYSRYSRKPNSSIGVCIAINSDFFDKNADVCVDLNERSFSESYLPLYRCIYVDRERKLVTAISRMVNGFESDKEHKEYDKDIDELTTVIKNGFYKLQGLLSDRQLNRNICSRLLLNLRYLIKLDGWMSEQEFRIISIKPDSDKCIKSKHIGGKERKYINYKKMQKYTDRIIFSIDVSANETNETNELRKRINKFSDLIKAKELNIEVEIKNDIERRN